jgi:hypothetical protein
MHSHGSVKTCLLTHRIVPGASQRRFAYLVGMSLGGRESSSSISSRRLPSSIADSFRCGRSSDQVIKGDAQTLLVLGRV